MATRERDCFDLGMIFSNDGEVKQRRNEVMKNRTKYPRGGAACVARKRLADLRFGSVARKGVTGEILGCVAKKKVRGSKGVRRRKTERRGTEDAENCENCEWIDEWDQGRGKLAGRGSKTRMVPYLQI